MPVAAIWFGAPFLEYLPGTFLQVCLLPLASGWVGGRHFPHAKLLQFSVRRLGFVLKWALMIITATLLLIHPPLLAEMWFTGEPAGWNISALVDTIIRPLLTAVMLSLATVQIRLTLHNDSLRSAIAALGGWILAAWACFYKSRESGPQPVVF
jgi:hypothetical protein